METEMVSIVILAFDNFQALLRTVESIHENTDYPKAKFEIIVVQNPSGTLDEQLIYEQCIIWHGNWNNFKFVKNEQNLYHGRGSMEGVKLAEGSLICLCNDDIFIPARSSDWLKILVDFITQRENVATVTPAMYYPKETIYWIGKDDPESPYHNYLHVPKGDPRLPVDPVKTIYNNMAACLTWKWILDKIPLGQSTIHYGTDSEFASRIRDELDPRWEHWVVPKVKIYHFNIYHLRSNRGKDKAIEG